MLVNIPYISIYISVWLVLNHHFVATLCLSFRIGKYHEKGSNFCARKGIGLLNPFIGSASCTKIPCRRGPRVKSITLGDLHSEAKLSRNFLAAEKLGKFVSSRSPAKKNTQIFTTRFSQQQKRRRTKGQKKGQRNNKHFMFSPFVFYLLKSLWAAFTCNLLRTTCASTLPKHDWLRQKLGCSGRSTSSEILNSKVILSKSCTTWDVWNHVNNGIFTISTG